MQNLEKFEIVLKNFAILRRDVDDIKNLALTLNKMYEYNSCDQIRISLYKFRNKFLEEIKNMANDISHDFSFVATYVQNIEEQLYRLTGLRKKGILKTANSHLSDVEKSSNYFVLSEQTFTSEEKFQILDRSTIYQYSLKE